MASRFQRLRVSDSDADDEAAIATPSSRRSRHLELPPATDSRPRREGGRQARRGGPPTRVGRRPPSETSRHPTQRQRTSGAIDDRTSDAAIEAALQTASTTDLRGAGEAGLARRHRHKHARMHDPGTNLRTDDNTVTTAIAHAAAATPPCDPGSVAVAVTRAVGEPDVAQIDVTDKAPAAPPAPTTLTPYGDVGSDAAALNVVNGSPAATALAEQPDTPQPVAANPSDPDLVNPAAVNPPSSRQPTAPSCRSISFDLQSDSAVAAARMATPAPLPAEDEIKVPQRHPAPPSPSVLAKSEHTEPVMQGDDLVQLYPAVVKETVVEGGEVAWVLVAPHREDEVGQPLRIVGAPPRRLSHRARAQLQVAASAIPPPSPPVAIRPRTTPPPPPAPAPVTLVECGPAASPPPPPPPLSAEPPAAEVHLADEEAASLPFNMARKDVCGPWGRHRYDGHGDCDDAARITALSASQPQQMTAIETLARTLQPLAATPTETTTALSRHESEALLLHDPSALERGMRRFLSLQPAHLATMELHADAREGRRRSRITQLRALATERRAAQQEVAAEGGLWCTVTPLTDEPARDAEATSAAEQRADAESTHARATRPRRVMRVCGGALPVGCEGYEAWCYELMLFAHESLAPEATECRAERPALRKGAPKTNLPAPSAAEELPDAERDALTLGQLVTPPLFSMPLTPRLVDDTLVVTEYKRRLVATKPRAVVMENNEADHRTALAAGNDARIDGDATARGPAAADRGPQYMTLTLATLNTTKKHTIDLSLVLLPCYTTAPSDAGDDDAVVVRVPFFSPSTVVTHRRLHGISISFESESAFLSAYRALLWTTECNILRIAASDLATHHGLTTSDFAVLETCATTSPLVSWGAVCEASEDGAKGAGELTVAHGFRENCVNYAVLALSTTEVPGAAGGALALEDFVTTRSDGTPCADCSDMPLVGLTAYGVVRRAINQRTHEVMDVRIAPRCRTRLLPCSAAEPDESCTASKTQEERALQHDVEAAILIEYSSRLPFNASVFGVLVDELHYYIFQEPWLSALSLERRTLQYARRVPGLSKNVPLQAVADRVSVVTLKEFIHGVLHPRAAASGDAARDGGVAQLVQGQEGRLQLAHLLAAQLLLLIVAMHGKGVLLGPCAPQRLLVRIESPPPPGDAQAARDEEDDASGIDASEQNTAGIDTYGQPADSVSLTAGALQEPSCVAPSLSSSAVRLLVPEIGLSNAAWGYERQQCGVVEYISPQYLLDQFGRKGFGLPCSTWTTRDDWWSYLCILFELLALDGSSLVMPDTTMTAGQPSSPDPASRRLSHFAFPEEVLEVWKGVLCGPPLASDEVDDGDVVDHGEGVGGAYETDLATRVRRYVHSRVLDAIAPTLDSWVAARADELAMQFSEAAHARGDLAQKGGATREGGSNVALSSVHGQTDGAQHSLKAAVLGDKSFIASKAARSVLASSTSGAGHTLREMPWVFHYRDLIDCLLETIFAPSSASDGVSAARWTARRLLAQPFFATLDMTAVFDGTAALTPACASFVQQQLHKRGLQALLQLYRQGPSTVTASSSCTVSQLGHTATLMLTNAAQAASSDVPPLLLLAAPPEVQGGPLPRRARPDKNDGGAAQREDLVHSRSPSAAAAALTSRPSDSTGAVKHSTRLREMYRVDELRAINQLESEVRSALNSHQALNIYPCKPLSPPRPHIIAASVNSQAQQQSTTRAEKVPTFAVPARTHVEPHSTVQSRPKLPARRPVPPQLTAADELQVQKLSVHEPSSLRPTTMITQPTALRDPLRDDTTSPHPSAVHNLSSSSSSSSSPRLPSADEIERGLNELAAAPPHLQGRVASLVK